MVMERQWLLNYDLIVLSFSIITSCYAIESPQYVVVSSALDLEIRLYKESLWISALVQPPTSFKNSTQNGFHRLYQYTHGANENSLRLKMTSPILTCINHVAAENATNYSVKFYVPQKYEAVLPQPNADLDLHIEKWRNHCIAVKKFPGFAKDDNIDAQKETLLSSLDKLSGTGKGKSGDVVIEDRSSYAVAQYNASFRTTGRLNEVWMNVSAQGCAIY